MQTFLYTLLCSRADLLSTKLNLKHERKTKRILGGFFETEYLYINYYE